jgi:2-C-methyl-D-erythritol 4-phosphate cytidylyltransferase/2-C-methyl-D-erythritol 2,4-cyclodiphosphate synthase
MTTDRVWAVVVAAGDGRRLGRERPKAFVKLGGRPLLAHAIELFEAHPRVERMVVVVPEGWEEPTALLADELAAGKVAASVPGGATRALSVAAGLAEVPVSATAILVHDAARPFASEALVDRVLAALETADGAVPGVPVADTVKRVGGGAVVETLERAELRAVQTPQAFRTEALRRAYAGPPAEIASATDCAQLVERAGGRVIVVEGEPANAKITDADDLARAEAQVGGRT